ncbi:MAG: hypothetical protein ABUL41_01080 [Chitinophagaceae bacterium]
MKTQPKIQLSLYEMELVNNTDWILTKNDILRKVQQLLADLQEKQQDHLKSLSSSLPEDVLKASSKISKGENYQGLPYLILDYPRYFDHKDIFAIRTMFWWGNFFSITLQLSGKYKILFSEKILSGYKLLKEKDFYACVHEEQWQHHFESNNYAPINNLAYETFTNNIQSGAFVKIANAVSLKEWEKAPDILFQYFKLIIGLLTD